MDELVRAYVRAAIRHPPAVAWNWLQGRPSGEWRAHVTTTEIELVRGEARASVGVARLREVFALEYAAHLSYESFWLFAQDPVACVANGNEQKLAEDLEARLCAFDQAVRDGALGDREAVRRGVLLTEARMAGLFDTVLWKARIAALEAWQLAELISLAKAGRAMAEYLDSTERGRYVRDAKSRTIEQVPLSLDLIRRGVPANVNLHAWLASAEAAMSRAKLSGTSGTIYVGQGGRTVVLKWRCEDGKRNAIYEASLQA